MCLVAFDAGELEPEDSVPEPCEPFLGGVTASEVKVVGVCL